MDTIWSPSDDLQLNRERSGDFIDRAGGHTEIRRKIRKLVMRHLTPVEQHLGGMFRHCVHKDGRRHIVFWMMCIMVRISSLGQRPLKNIFGENGSNHGGRAVVEVKEFENKTEGERSEARYLSLWEKHLVGLFRHCVHKDGRG